MSFYSIYATKRSGHHAFIEWMCNGLKGEWLYLNNLSFYDGELCFSKAVTSLNVNIRPGGVSEALESWAGKVDHIIFSYENISGEYLSRAVKFEESCKSVVDKGEQVRIVFLRDFFNSYASQFSWFEARGKAVDLKAAKAFKESWKDLAMMFVGEKEREGVNEGELLFYSFNNFVFNDSVRQEVSQSLAIDDAKMNSGLSKFGGGGNSFFKSPENYKVDKEDLEARWTLVKNKEEFVASVDSESLRLAEEFADKIGRNDLYSVPYGTLFS